MEKGKLMMIIIIALLVLLLGTVVGVSFYVLSLVRNQATAEGEDSARSSQQVVLELSRSEITLVSMGNAIQTNLQPSGDGKDHYAVITMEVGYDNSQEDLSTEMGELLAADMPKVRNIALGCIYSKTYEDLDTPDELEALADEILAQLQEVYNTSMIVEVNISDRLIQ